jgi:hypothetical protein
MCTALAAVSRTKISGEGRILDGKQVIGEVEYELTISEDELQFDAFGQADGAPIVEGDLYTDAKVPIGVALDLELKDRRKITFVSCGPEVCFFGHFH